jgi:hypothetical protein
MLILLQARVVADKPGTAGKVQKVKGFRVVHRDTWAEPLTASAEVVADYPD